MQYLYIIVFMVTYFTIATGMPSGETTNGATGQSSPAFADIVAQAQAGINNLGKELQEKLNLPNQETVIDSIKTQSTNLVTNVQNYIAQVSEDVKAENPELGATWEHIKNKLTLVIEDLNGHIPNATEQASQLQARFTNGLNVIVEEASKAAKTINQNSGKIQEDVAKFTKEAVDIAVQTTRNLENQLRELAVTEGPK